MNQVTKAMKAVKSEQHSTKKSKPANLGRDSDFKKSPWLDQYDNFYTNSTHPVSQAIIDKIACELIDHVKTTDGYLRHEWFFIDRNMDPRTARKWADKYEMFGRTYRIAKLIMGIRREDGALKKKLDAGIVTLTMPSYDEEWKELMEWRNKMRQESEQSLLPMTAIFPAFKPVEVKEDIA